MNKMTSSLNILILFSAVLTTIVHAGCPDDNANPMPIYRYWNGSVKDHFYTQNPNELGPSGGGGWGPEGVAFNLPQQPISGWLPVYRYWKGAPANDHFYTTNASEIGTTTLGASGNYGYTSEPSIGYISPNPLPGLVPVYRYWNGSVYDHFYTINASEIGTTTVGATGNDGYVMEMILGYAYPPNANPTPVSQ